MYYNRNLITASEQEVTRKDASGVFDLQTQAVSQNEKDWPGSETASIIYDITIGVDHLTIEVPSTGSVSYTIDWGDGTIESSTSNSPSHTYSSTGSYKIKIFSTAVYRPYINNNISIRDVVQIVEITENANLGTNLTNAFNGLNKVHTFKCAFSATNGVTNFQNMFAACTVLAHIDLFDTSSGTNLAALFRNIRGGFFPAINTSSATNIGSMYRETFTVVELPSIDTSNVSGYSATWRTCNIKSFPSFYDFSSGTNFGEAWRGSSIFNFPANMFDSTGTLPTNAFNNAFNGAKLTAQSIENVLTSLDTNGATGIQLHIGGGSNASYSTWSSAAQTALSNLQSKSWTVTYNS
tara:strand:+ start:1122 stop:2174 length:1053 start_codon:yes stop_codon:yes gene_type:complete